jgi:hypothetical protein
MITDLAERYVISNLGWVDHGSVWRFDARTGTAGAIPLSDASYLVVRQGPGDLFTAAHHFNGDRLLITAQSYERPDIACRHPLADQAPRGPGASQPPDTKALASDPSSLHTPYIR